MDTQFHYSERLYAGCGILITYVYGDLYRYISYEFLIPYLYEN